MDSLPKQATTPSAENSPTPTGETQKPLSPVGIFWYSTANLGYGTFYALNNFILPLFLKHYTNDARLIGLMSSSDSIEGVVVQPLVGSASDRLRTRWGRRMPFMLVCIPLSALFIYLTTQAGWLPSHLRLAFVVGCIFLFTVLFNAAWSPYQALLPDITPEAQRGRVMALSTLAGLIGQAGILLSPTSIPMKFTLSALLMIVTTFLTCRFIREPEHGAVSTTHSPLQEIKIVLSGLPVLQQASKAMVVLFLSGLGIGSVLPFLTPFVVEITHCTESQAQTMPLVLMVSSACTVLFFGKMTDTMGAKKVLLIGTGLIVVASFAGLWVQTLPQIAFILAIAGIGNAAQSAASYPLLTELVPAEEVGFYTGLQRTAASLAMPLTTVLTGTLINQGGYRVIFGVCGVSLLLSMFVLARIWVDVARNEVVSRDRQMGRGV